MNRDGISTIAGDIASKYYWNNMNRMVEDLAIIESTLSEYKEELSSKNTDKTLKRYMETIKKLIIQSITYNLKTNQ